MGLGVPDQFGAFSMYSLALSVRAAFLPFVPVAQDEQKFPGPQGPRLAAQQCGHPREARFPGTWLAGPKALGVCSVGSVTANRDYKNITPREKTFCSKLFAF